VAGCYGFDMRLFCHFDLHRHMVEMLCGDKMAVTVRFSGAATHIIPVKT